MYHINVKPITFCHWREETVGAMISFVYTWWFFYKFVNNLTQIIYFRQGVMHPHLKVYVAHFVYLQVSIKSFIWNRERDGVTVFNNSLEMAEKS